MPISHEPEYIHYAVFERNVEQSVAPEHYHAFRHVLPMVDLQLRRRFLNTVLNTAHIPGSSSLTERGKKLPELNYLRYLKFMMSKSN